METQVEHSGCPRVQAKSFGSKESAAETTADEGLPSKSEQWSV